MSKSISTDVADLYGLLNDLSEHINGHYHVNDNGPHTSVRFTKGTVFDVRWVSENINNNLPFDVKEIKPYDEYGFELILKAGSVEVR